MINPRKKHFFRQLIETQFKQYLNALPEFNFLISLGINEIFQTVGTDEVDFIGILHIKWIKKTKEWAFIWYDVFEEGIEAHRKWFEDVSFNRTKIIHIHQEFCKNKIKESKTSRIVLN
jgi:hypothetical protein